jgi:4-amino-4-deoxy-L-arabinose transferase-like glycosyltransferase
MYLLTFELLKQKNTEERKRISFYAGLITAFIPILAKSSIVTMSDSLSLMFAIWAMLQFVKYFESYKTLQLVSASALLALAVLTRYGYVFLLVPMTAILVYKIPYLEIKKNKLLRDTVVSFVCGIIVFSPQLYYILNYGIANFHSQDDLGIWSASWSPLNFIRNNFTTFDGIMHYKLWNGLYNLSPVFHPMYLSMFGITFLAGLYYMGKQKEYHILMFTLSWFFVYYLYFSGSPYQSLRFLMSYMPALIIVSVLGLSEVKIKLILKQIFLTGGIAVFIIYSFYHMSVFSKQKNSELEVVNYVITSIPDNSAVFAFEITMAVNHYTVIKAYELFNCSEMEIKNKIDSSSGSVYFIVPVEQIKTQWKGLPLDKKYEFVKSNYPLQTMTQINRFTIYKIPHSK